MQNNVGFSGKTFFKARLLTKLTDPFKLQWEEAIVKINFAFIFPVSIDFSRKKTPLVINERTFALMKVKNS